MLRKKKTIVALALIPQYFIVQWLSHYPEFVEAYYSHGVYPLISKVFRFTLGWLPFSFGDLMYTCAGIYVIKWFYSNWKRLRRDTKNWCIDVLAAVSIMYGAFHILWGLNYHRLPLHVSLNLKRDYTTEQLMDVTKLLIKTSYAAENEANFIGFLATINHDNIYLKYTGYTFALRFCLNEIYRRDPDLYKLTVAEVNPGILKNYKAVRDFWEAHENPAEPLFKIFYGHFLKANKQSKGMESYNYVVALLVNYFEGTPE